MSRGRSVNVALVDPLWHTKGTFDCEITNSSLFFSPRTRSISLSAGCHSPTPRKIDMLLYYNLHTKAFDRRTLEHERPFAYRRLQSDGEWSDPYLVTAVAEGGANVPLVPHKIPERLLKDIHYLLLKDALEDILDDLYLSKNKWCPRKDLTAYEWMGKLSSWIDVTCTCMLKHFKDYVEPKFKTFILKSTKSLLNIFHKVNISYAFKIISCLLRWIVKDGWGSEVSCGGHHQKVKDHGVHSGWSSIWLDLYTDLT